MNPLTREQRRRRGAMGLILILVIPVTIGLAGIVGPSFGRHRSVTDRALLQAAEHDDAAKQIQDLIEFKQFRLGALEEAEKSLALLVPSEALPIDYRDSTRQRLDSDGIHVTSIAQTGEISTEPTEQPFDIIRVEIGARVEFAHLREFLDRLVADARPVVVERVDVKRAGDELHELEATCQLAYLRRKTNPDAPGH